ncbi:MAG: hypothetical protein RLN70_05025, partial [Rhodospirillaceae bacterium]
MRLKTSAWALSGVAALSLLAGCASPGEMGAEPVAEGSVFEAAPLATPPGVTVQLAGQTNFTLIIGYALDRGRNQTWSYADENGMTLYTYKLDTEAGKSSCYEACAERFPPFVADADAEPVGEWAVIQREDGERQ